MKMDRKYKPELCVNDHRSRIGHPYLDTGKRRMVATNGSILLTISVAVDDDDTDGFIPGDVIDYARKKAEDRGEDIRIIALKTKLIVGEATFVRPKSGDCPDIESILKSVLRSEDDVIFGVDRDYVDTLISAINPGAHEGIFYRFDPKEKAENGGHNGPIRVYLQGNSNDAEEVAVIMPRRWTGEKTE